MISALINCNGVAQWLEKNSGEKNIKKRRGNSIVLNESGHFAKVKRTDIKIFDDFTIACC